MAMTQTLKLMSVAIRSGRSTCHLGLTLSQIYIGPKTVTRTKDGLLNVLITKGAEKKKRTFAASTIHGQVEPLAFLMVWLQMGSDLTAIPTRKEHLDACKPSDADVAAWVAERGHEFNTFFENAFLCISLFSATLGVLTPVIVIF